MQSTFTALRQGLAALVLGLAPLVAAVPAGAADIAVVPAARDALPASVRDSGTLRVATSLQWAPFGYVDEAGKQEGIDLRLLDVLAAKMGLKTAVEDIKFPAIIPGVESGRYDVGANQIGITADG